MAALQRRRRAARWEPVGVVVVDVREEEVEVDGTSVESVVDASHTVVGALSVPSRIVAHGMPRIRVPYCPQSHNRASPPDSA